jgi:hypothetical protein
MSTADVVLERLRRAGVAAMATFGSTAALAVLSETVLVPELLVALVAVVGWFVVTPSFLFLDVSLPFVDDGDDEPADPLERLRDRYAAGELTEAEFERKLDRLLETETEAGPGPRAGAEDEAPPSSQRERETDHGVEVEAGTE